MKSTLMFLFLVLILIQLTLSTIATNPIVGAIHEVVAAIYVVASCVIGTMVKEDK